jgi:type IV secretion system protein VirB10
MIELGKDPRPSLTLPRELIPLPVAVGLGAIMALGLLIYLLSYRGSDSNEDDTMQTPAQMAPPELILPSPYPSQYRQPIVIQSRPVQASPQPRFVRPQASYPPVTYAPLSRRSIEEDNYEPLNEPNRAEGLIAIDLGRARGADRQRNSDVEEGIERSRREDEAVPTTQIRNRATTIAEGAIIAAVLETPLNSDRPGLARAIVSQDVRGFDGTRVLIPRGSRLIGEFKAEVTPGLRRIPVIWTRLVRPDGVAINIGSPGADALGGAGIAGRVDTHLAQRLFGAVLQSALTIGVNVVSALPTKGSSPVFVGLPGQAQQVGEQLVPKVDRAPTVKVREGAEISVLVARDLDFSRTPVVR